MKKERKKKPKPGASPIGWMRGTVLEQDADALVGPVDWEQTEESARPLQEQDSAGP